MQKWLFLKQHFGGTLGRLAWALLHHTICIFALSKTQKWAERKDYVLTQMVIWQHIGPGAAHDYRHIAWTILWSVATIRIMLAISSVQPLSWLGRRTYGVPYVVVVDLSKPARSVSWTTRTLTPVLCIVTLGPATHCD